MCIYIYVYVCVCVCVCVCVGRDSSVGIASRYGLDGPGIEFRLGRDFPQLSRLALGPIHSGYRVSFLGGKAAGEWC